MIAARLSPGAISKSSSRYLTYNEASPKSAKPVMFPRNDALGDRVGHARKDDRDRLRLPLDGNRRRGRVCQDDVGLQADQLLRERSYPIIVTAVPPQVHPHVAAIGPTQVRKRLGERREDSLHQLGVNAGPIVLAIIVHRHIKRGDPTLLQIVPIPLLLAKLGEWFCRVSPFAWRFQISKLCARAYRPLTQVLLADPPTKPLGGRLWFHRSRPR